MRLAIDPTGSSERDSHPFHKPHRPIRFCVYCRISASREKFPLSSFPVVPAGTMRGVALSHSRQQTKGVLIPFFFAGVLMRVYEMHAHAKQVQRSSGRSSVSAAAYRSGSRLYDDRTGLWHDFSNKKGVEYSRIYMPDHAPDWRGVAATEAETRYANATPEKQRKEAERLFRQKLWNAVEVKEKRRDATTAHEIVLAFPSEFNAMQRREAGDAVSREAMRRYNAAVDISYHRPDTKIQPEDQSKKVYANYHAHMMFTTRGFDEKSKDWSAKKFRDLSQDKALDAEGNRTTRGQLEILSLREFIAGEMNRIAERDGLEVHTEHLSFEARGIDREPTQHMGATATQMEREDKASDRGDINREIQAANDNRKAMQERLDAMDKAHQEELKVIDLEIERERRQVRQPPSSGRKRQAEERKEYWQIARLEAEKQQAEAQLQARQNWLFKFVFRGRYKEAQADLQAKSQALERAEAQYKADMQALKEHTRGHDPPTRSIDRLERTTPAASRQRSAEVRDRPPEREETIDDIMRDLGKPQKTMTQAELRADYEKMDSEPANDNASMSYVFNRQAEHEQDKDQDIGLER